MIPLFTFLGAVLGLMALAHMPDPQGSVPERRSTGNQPQSNPTTTPTNPKHRSQQATRPAGQDRHHTGALLERAKELAQSGDVVLIRQMISEMENRIEVARDNSEKDQDALNARSFLIGEIKKQENVSPSPQARAAASESRELRTAMGEAMR